MKKQPIRKKRSTRSKMDFYHLYFKRSGLYTFLYKHLFQLIIGLGLLFLLIYLLQNHLPNFEDSLDTIFKKLNMYLILGIFFVSESFLGLIPPDFFIAWCNSFERPYLMVSILAVLSYMGGVISYLIGKGFGKIPKIETFILRKFIRHFNSIKKWGGIMIVFAALFPLPYSAVCIAAGMVRYPFTTFIFLGITRMARFYIYALLIFKALDL